MGIRYFDADLGRTRFKRRYVWAAWAYAVGTASGLLLSGLTH